MYDYEHQIATLRNRTVILIGLFQDDTLEWIDVLLLIAPDIKEIQVANTYYCYDQPHLFNKPRVTIKPSVSQECTIIDLDKVFEFLRYYANMKAF